MLKVYGSAKCPDCIALKKNYDFYGIEYEFTEVLESLKNLHEFLALRDHSPVFDHCKEIGDIGLPTVVKEDGEIYINWEERLEAEGKEVLSVETNAQACSLDHKGC